MSESTYINRDITTRIKLGELAALKEIYSKHWKNIYVIAYSFLKSKPDAEDAVHDIIIRFWQNREKLNENSDYKPYLFQIARNALVNIIKSNSRSITDELVETVHPSSEATEEYVAYNELSKFAQEAIDKLPPKRKLVFDLCRNHGFTKHQVANEMGISITMVDKQLKLANSFIRNYLKVNAGLDIHLTILYIAIFLS